MERLHTDSHNLRECQVVRLDTELFPVIKEEAALYRRYQLDLIELKAGDPKEIMDRAAGCDALIVVSSALPETIIEHLHHCRIISRRGIGTDKIDVTAATRAGILVTNVPGFCADEMAEHTMALILSVARKIPRMSHFLTEGRWGQARSEALRNRRLAGRILGLIGFGLSAQLVARRAMAFGMRLLATRRHFDEPSPEADELDVRMVDLDTLLAQSDYISLHLPLTDETYHLLDKARLSKMKPGACLINTARGAVVDEPALVEALRKGRLGGAGIDTYEGIDVFSGKEGPPEHPFLELDNVVLTPHVASESIESQQDVATGAVTNLLCVLSGHWPPPTHVVNPGVNPRVTLAEYDTSLFEGTHMR